MIELTLPALSQWLGAWLFPLFRLGGFFLVAPVFGMRTFSVARTTTSFSGSTSAMNSGARLRKTLSLSAPRRV